MFRSSERDRRAVAQDRVGGGGVAPVRLVQDEAARQPRRSPPSLAGGDDHALGGRLLLRWARVGTPRHRPPARPMPPADRSSASARWISVSRPDAAADGRGRHSIQARRSISARCGRGAGGRSGRRRRPASMVGRVAHHVVERRDQDGRRREDRLRPARSGPPRWRRRSGARSRAVRASRSRPTTRAPGTRDGKAKCRRGRPRAGIQHPLAGSRRDRGRQQHGVDRDAVAAARLEEAQPAAEQPVVAQVQLSRARHRPRRRPPPPAPARPEAGRRPPRAGGVGRRRYCPRPR